MALYAEQRLAQNVSPASINIELAALSAAINYAKKRWEIELNNPVTGLFYPAKPGRLRYLEKYEATELFPTRSIPSNIINDIWLQWKIFLKDYTNEKFRATGYPGRRTKG